MKLLRRLIVCSTLLVSSLSFAAHAASPTLARIRQTRTLRCGINQETPEYSSTDDHGVRAAFDAAFCRAVAVAILGPHARTVLTPYPDDITSMAALRSGRVDLLPTLTLDLTHSSKPALAFSPPILYDGVGFLVPASANLNSPAQLSGRKICFLAATRVEPALQAWFSQQHLDFVPFPFNEEGEMEAAFVTGNCATLAGDLTRLVNLRQSFEKPAFRPTAASYSLLPDPVSHSPVVIAPDPLAAASPATDPAFARIVTWTLEVLLDAEAVHLTQDDAARLLLSRTAAPAAANPTLDILSGRTAEIGTRLGLRNTWALEVLAAVGNYAEIYARTLGDQSPLELPRSQNRLSTGGGLMLPLPLK